MGLGSLAAFATLFYFSEGFPFGIVNELLPLYLRSSGVSLTEIGLLSTVGLAWTLKLFWAPAVDAFGTYPRWVSGGLVGITVALVMLATLPLTGTPWFWVAVTLLAVGSATQDVAVDAWTIVATEKRWLGIVNSIRITAYRVAMIVAGGGFAAIADRVGWASGFGIAAGVAGALLIASFFLPAAERVERERIGVLEGLRSWLAQPRAGLLLLLVLLYKLGDSSLNPMIRPFWVDRGFPLGQIGAAVSTIGVGATIVGAWIAGAAVARWGLYRSMIWFGVLQIASNIVYAVIAAWPALSQLSLYGASLVENLTYGLGTGTFLAFLMAICDRTRAATEYALLSALFGLSRSLIGMVSGAVTDALGYAPYFWITVLLGLPGLLLVPLARGIIERTDAEPAPASEV